MKKAILILFVVALFATVVLLIQTSCCRNFGQDPYDYPGMLFKYKQGAELPENFHSTKAYLRDKWDKPFLRQLPLQLQNGYYLTFDVAWSNSWEYRDVVILNFTLAEYESGNVPENWIEHWEDYVLIENPLCEGGILPFYHCEKNRGVPYWCENCTSTNNIDTTCVNQMIINNEIWDYAWLIYTDTTTIVEVKNKQ